MSWQSVSGKTGSSERKRATLGVTSDMETGI